jgi:hypothetical protein
MHVVGAATVASACLCCESGWLVHTDAPVARQAEANKFSALETKFKALEEEHNDLLVMLADGGAGEGAPP